MMLESCLIQRLKAAPKSEFHAKAEQVFGGGMLMLSPEAWKVLQAIFSIDYMGRAEFEFGTIPNTLKAMAGDADKLRAFTVTIPAADIEPNYERKRPARTARGKPRKKQPVHPPVTDKTVYVLAREAHKAEIPERLKLLAGRKIRLLEYSRFPEALDPMTDFDRDVRGWLEIDNGFFFFTDADMWRKTTVLLTGREPEGSELIGAFAAP